MIKTYGLTQKDFVTYKLSSVTVLDYECTTCKAWFDEWCNNGDRSTELCESRTQSFWDKCKSVKDFVTGQEN